MTHGTLTYFDTWMFGVHVWGLVDMEAGVIFLNNKTRLRKGPETPPGCECRNCAARTGAAVAGVALQNRKTTQKNHIANKLNEGAIIEQEKEQDNMDETA